MRGLIVYDAREIARNQGFIDWWMQVARERGVALCLARVEDMALGVRAGARFLDVCGAPEKPDFVVMRAHQPLLSKHLEGMGVPVFNNAFVSETLNDKRKTHDYLRDVVPMCDTAFILGDQACPFPFPAVVKGADGCGGRQVRLAQNETEYRAALRDFGYSAVVQPLCDTPGRDVRVYMLGRQIVQGMLRYSEDGDFRSNFGLHGTAKPIDVPPDIARMARAVAERFDFGLVGVDFIFDHGRPLFNEAEDAVGTRMLYKYTKLDIVQMYMDFILSRLE